MPFPAGVVAARAPFVLGQPGIPWQKLRVPGIRLTVRFAFPFSGPAPAIDITGRLALDVYSTDGATFLGTIPVVFGTQIVEQVNQVAQFQVMVPAEYKALIPTSALIKIVREGEGVIFVGYADVLQVDDA